MKTNSAISPRLFRARGRVGVSGVSGMVLLAVTFVVAGCSSSDGGASSASPTAPSSASSFQAAHVTSHGLRITGGYVPKPASPDVAAAYLTIANTTDTSVRLINVRTSVTGSVMAMNESDNGSVGSMTDLSRIDIPAHGSYRFEPNHAHLMLQHPTALKAGENVSMTLTFTGVGSVLIMLPVVPLGQLPSGVPSTYSSAGTSMAPMTGMTMSTSG